MLILKGAAALTPADGSEVVTIGAGDQVTFHKGFKCKWKITERMYIHISPQRRKKRGRTNIGDEEKGKREEKNARAGREAETSKDG